MKHYGDICKMNGAEIEPVDVITGGSPCQDLSIAGARAGLDGERSGLFIEQIRIVKEMRENDIRNGRTAESARPRYMVWENVPGSFSSNGGKDFQTVLTEIVRVTEPECPDVPLPKKGKWPKFGSICDELGGWSVAWRTHDAQYWGVPQRRRRVCVLADFNGVTAADILFDPQLRRETKDSESDKAVRDTGRKPRRKVQAKSESLFGNPESSGEAGEETAGAAGDSSYPSVARSLTRRYDGSPCIDRGPDVVVQGVAHTLNGVDRHGIAIPSHAVCAAFSFGQSEKARSIGYREEVSPTLRGGEVGNQKPCVYDARGNGDGETVCTITGDHQNRVTDYTALYVGIDLYNQATTGGVSKTLSSAATDSDHIQCVMKCFQNTGQGWWDESDVGATIRTPCGGDSVKANLALNAESVVRRITPLECERLQGYPDGWTDIGEWVDSKGKKHKEADSPRYKALGNSIALPFWFYLLRRISATYERPATLGSLFDGIGGFPLAFERAGGKAIWASEIEEYPIAVTKRRFPE